MVYFDRNGIALILLLNNLHLKGISDSTVQRIASRLLQSEPLVTPSLAQMKPSEWKAFGGRKLVMLEWMAKRERRLFMPIHAFN